MNKKFFDLFVVLDKKNGTIIESICNEPFDTHIQTVEDLDRFWLERLHLQGCPIFEEYKEYIFIREIKGDFIYYFAIEKNSILIKYFFALEKSSLLDNLTKCYKKEYCYEFIEKLLKTFLRYKSEKFSIIMFDLDFFKKINDTYGHLCGDYVLENVATIVRKNLRESDIFCRFGGEEFILILPKTPAPGALRLARRLQEALSSHIFHYHTYIFHITASFGVTTASLTDSVESLIERCDQALYSAKERGRNRIEYL